MLLEHVAVGLFEFATCHNHQHFRDYATYELKSPPAWERGRGLHATF
ncbi:MAG: hypothetical protein LC795_19380 [Acidobacteria bacterium]|nr:hypothetical protein [Acidobacteriota bacterium]